MKVFETVKNGQAQTQVSTKSLESQSDSEQLEGVFQPLQLLPKGSIAHSSLDRQKTPIRVLLRDKRRSLRGFARALRMILRNLTYLRGSIGRDIRATPIIQALKLQS